VLTEKGEPTLMASTLARNLLGGKARATSHQPTEEKGIEHSSLTDFSINLS
jgi:hypothetical protein